MDAERIPVDGWDLEDIPVVCYWCEEVMTFGEWADLADA